VETGTSDVATRAVSVWYVVGVLVVVVAGAAFAFGLPDDGQCTGVPGETPSCGEPKDDTTISDTMTEEELNTSANVTNGSVTRSGDDVVISEAVISDS